MLRIFSKGLLCFSLTSLCLMIGCVLWSVPAAAQGSTAVHGDQSGSDTARKKDVKFEVISIRPVTPGWTLEKPSPLPVNSLGPTPDGYISRLNLGHAILVAYADTVGIDAWIYTPLLNLPTWSGSWYDINARVSNGDLAAWQSQGSQHEMLRSAMQDLLKERCKLVIHRQPTDLPDYKMVIGKKVSKLKATPPGFVIPAGGKLESGGVLVPDRATNIPVLHFYGATMEDLASFQSRFANRPVHDMTGLTGHYNFTLEVSQNDSRDIDEMTRFPIDALGLELKPGKYAGSTLVIDHVEEPDAN